MGPEPFYPGMLSFRGRTVSLSLRDLDPSFPIPVPSGEGVDFGVEGSGVISSLGSPSGDGELSDGIPPGGLEPSSDPARGRGLSRVPDPDVAFLGYLPGKVSGVGSIVGGPGLA